MSKLGGDALRRERKKLKVEPEALRSSERNSEEEKHAIAGRIVLEHASKDKEFAETLSRILDVALRKRRERDLFDLPGLSKGRLASRTSEATASGPAAIAATTEEKILPAAGGLSPTCSAGKARKALHFRSLDLIG